MPRLLGRAEGDLRLGKSGKLTNRMRHAGKRKLIHDTDLCSMYRLFVSHKSNFLLLPILHLSMEIATRQLLLIDRKYNFDNVEKNNEHTS